MYNINQQKPSIKSLFVDNEKKENQSTLDKEALSKLCTPTSEYLFKNCMEKSEQYNEFAEGEHVLKFSVPAAIADDEEKAEEYKANLFNSYDTKTNTDYATLGTAYFNCFFEHYNQCMESNNKI